MRPAHVWTAVAVLAGGISLYVAAIAPPELAYTFDAALDPNWLSFGYPPEVVTPGKLRQTLVLFAVACFALAGGWHLAAPLLRRERTRGYWIALSALTALLGACVWLFGNRHFGAVDQSLAIDVGWRLVRGQQPYRDFICTLPPGFFLPPKWAFQLLGVAWSSLVVLTAAFAIVTFVWQALLLRVLIGHDAASLTVATAFQTLGVVIASFWWYNPITTAAGVIYLLSALVLLRGAPRFVPLLSYTASLVLLASMKPNVAALLIAGGTLILLTSKAHRLAVLASSAVAFALFVAILWSQSLSLPELLRSYLSIAGRGAPSPGLAFKDVNFVERQEVAAALLLALAPLAFVRWRARELPWRTVALLLLSALTGAYAVFAHGELKYIDAPFLLLPGAIAALTTASLRPRARQWTLAVCLTLIAFATALGAMRQRIERIGFGVFFEWELDPRTPRHEFFSSLRTGPRFHAVASQVDGLLREVGDARVCFGIRLESFYAATKRDSPRGFPPLLWHGNTFHPQAREEELIDYFRRGDFDVLVFLWRDLTHFPLEARRAILQNYVISIDHVQRYPNLTVFFSRRRYSSVPDEVVKLGGNEVAHRLRQAGVHTNP